MATRNSTEIIGFISSEGEWKLVPGYQDKVYSFRVAVKESFHLSQGGKREIITYYTIRARTQLAEICSKMVRVGGQVLVEGRVSSHPWKDPEGNMKASLTLAARDIQFLGHVPVKEDPIPSV